MNDIRYFPVRQLETLFTEKCNLNCTYCFETQKKNWDMKKEDLQDLVDRNFPLVEFYPFGGEPFLNIEVMTGLMDKVEASDLDIARKQQLLQGLKFHISNGTLIGKYKDLILKYKLSLQISLDGPEDVNDANRVDFDGKGYWKIIMANVKELQAAGCQIGIHSAIAIGSYSKLYDIFRFHFDWISSASGMEEAIRSMGENILQVIFEDDIQDNDIDIFLDQMFRITEWIMKTKEYELSKAQRDSLLANWLLRCGSRCIAGNKMIAMDSGFNLYPCHRLAMSTKRDQFTFGSIKGPRNFDNFQTQNAFLQINLDKQMYSAYLDNDNFKTNPAWMNWCPASNRESKNSVFYQVPRHNTLMAEIQYFVEDLANYYQVDIFKIRKNTPGSACMNCANVGDYTN